MSKHVTENGRVVKTGRVTRASLNVRGTHRGQEQPLSIHLQCHPMALTATPLHPHCYKSTRHAGLALRLIAKYSRAQWLAGKGLKRTPCMYKVVEQLPEGDEKVYGWTDDITYAMAFKLGLFKALAFKTDVYED